MKKISFPKIYIIILFLCLAAYIGIYPVFIEPYWIEIKKIKIDDSDVPPSFRGTTIVFLADIHHGPYFSVERVKNVVTLVNKLNPDIVLFGGDYVHRDEKYILPCFEELKNISPKIGKYGVLGNHDHWENPGLTKNAMTSAGITRLDNKGYWIKLGEDKIKIGGIGDLWEDSVDIQRTVSDVKIEDFVLVVSHNPDFTEGVKTDSIDIILSGHTHGGQVTLFGLYAPILPSQYGQKYRTGIIKTPNCTVIVSNGIGTISPPIRFFARPQILILKL